MTRSPSRRGRSEFPSTLPTMAQRSSFILPAIVDRSPLLVAISSGGVAPMLATAVRARIESVIDHSWARLAQFAERWRKPIRARRPSVAARRRLYEWLLDGPAAEAVRAGREPEADGLLEDALAQVEPPARGFVSLVGAGPGDPELLTLRALRALGRADVILTDRLVGPEILALARREAEVVDVGKTAGRARRRPRRRSTACSCIMRAAGAASYG